MLGDSLLCKSDYFEAYVVLTLRCKRWSCGYCGPLNAKNLALKVAKAKPNKLITLTINPAKFFTPLDAYHSTRRLVPELARKIRNEGKAFEYLRVLEITKKGWPHYHLVARADYIKQRWISEAWRQLTGAYIVDIRAIYKAEHVYSYVMKYLCKQRAVPWTNRRISSSENFFAPEDETMKGKWKISSKTRSLGEIAWIVYDRFPGYYACRIGSEAWLLTRGPD